MARALQALTHSYEWRASDDRRWAVRGAREARLVCHVTLLDDSRHSLALEPKAKGQALLDAVFGLLELREPDYFGLSFGDANNPRWLEPQKRIRKQAKQAAEPQGLQLRLQVKFFVAEPRQLLEEFTRFQFFLQLRKDLASGRFFVPDAALALLASLALQAELGDHVPEEHAPGYSEEARVWPPARHEKALVARAEELHRCHAGMTPADAELQFLEVARAQQMYGVWTHVARDARGQEVQFRSEGRERFEHVLVFALPAYRACKSLWKACVEQHTFFRLQSPRPHTKKFFFFLALGSRFRYSGKTEFQTKEDARRRLALPDRHFVRTRSRLARQTVPLPAQANGGLGTPRVSSRVSESDAGRPKSAWTSNGSVSSQSLAFAPPHALPFIDTPSDRTDAHARLSLSSDESPVHVVTLRMRADQDGRFGFNVKGGHDQKCPVLVSRVAPSSPADQKGLREGDQLLAVAGQEVAPLSHEQIVQLIRACGAQQELALQIRPNVYAREAQPEEPSVAYVPQEASSAEELSPRRQSLLLLREQLDSGALALHFEQLARKKPGEPTTAARLPDNAHKNRYRDISPYDSTRVRLLGSASDYINASLVVMETPAHVLRYIATQGPLRETQLDFWLMVWEQRAPLVVMVTPLEEKGRSKCHKYWPEAHDPPLDAHGVHVRLACTRDHVTMVEREFVLSDQNDEHVVTHVQYVAWPDHGVPDQDDDFLALVARVRSFRARSHAPVVVHCSAGIGRTGVLILMETGLEVLEAGHPLFPLDLLLKMREQRAMLIQTAAQFRFVCHALLKSQRLVT